MHCIPPNLREECEWFELRDFVRHYNEFCGTAYELEKCLDVNSPGSSPQPEVLISSKNDRPMVIERKSVVWPSDHVQGLKKERAFASVLSGQLSPFLQDSSYALEVDSSEISARNDRQVTDVANKIAAAILSAKESGKIDRLCGRLPIEWVFGASDEWAARRGVTVVVRSHSNLFDLAQRECALQGWQAELAKQLANTPRKFVEYESCVRTVVVQFYGEDFSKEQVEGMVSRIVVPSDIDQVWMAYSEPVSDDEYETKYHRVHPRCTIEPEL